MLSISFSTLIARRDVQLLALVSCILLSHVQNARIPPRAETSTQHSPEQDYFALPRVRETTPIRTRSHISPPPSSPGPSSYRASGWSNILNPSNISLRGAMTPRERSSVDVGRTPLATSFEDPLPSPSRFSIPVPLKRTDSPRMKERSRNPQVASVSPPALTPRRSSGGKSLGSGVEPRSHPDPTRLQSNPSLPQSKVTFGAASPGRRATAHALPAKKRGKACIVRIDMLSDDSYVGSSDGRVLKLTRI